jgi:putative hydrolase of the HAD superfamily
VNVPAPVRLVSLDIGGTVAVIGPGSITAQLATALEREFATIRSALQPFKTYRSSPAQLATEVCAMAGRPEKINEVSAILDQYARDTALITLFDDVMPALSEIRALGIRIALFSNVMGCAAPPSGSAPPLDEAVDHTFYSCDIGYAKPDPLAFSAVASRLGVEAKEILHVGDALETDVRGALAAGWRSLLIDRSAPSDGPTWIRSLGSLPSRLGNKLDAGNVSRPGVYHATNRSTGH